MRDNAGCRISFASAKKRACAFTRALEAIFCCPHAIGRLSACYRSFHLTTTASKKSSAIIAMTLQTTSTAQVSAWRLYGVPSLVRNLPQAELALWKGTLILKRNNDRRGADRIDDFHFLKATGPRKKGDSVMVDNKPIVHMASGPSSNDQFIKMFLTHHPEAVDRILNLQPRLFAGKKVFSNNLDKACAIVKRNGMRYSDMTEPNQSDGWVLFQDGSFLNHSHNSNCERIAFRTASGDIHLKVVATQDIAIGDMLTMTYAYYEDRKDCACPVCNFRLGDRLRRLIGKAQEYYSKRT